MLSDKAADKITASLCSICDSFIATEPRNERKLSAELLAQMIEKNGRSCIIEREPIAALAKAREKIEKENFEVLLIAGSLYLIGEIRGILFEVRD